LGWVADRDADFNRPISRKPQSSSFNSNNNVEMLFIVMNSSTKIQNQASSREVLELASLAQRQEQNAQEAFHVAAVVEHR